LLVFVRFLCLYLIQIHISKAISTELSICLPLGLQEVVEYVWTHNIPPCRPFRPLFSRAGDALCAEDGCRPETFLRHPHIRDCWACSCDVAGVNVSRRQLRVPTGSVLYCGWCIQNAENWSECMFVKTQTWRDGQEVTNELQLYLRCDCTNDNVTPI